MNPGDHMAFLLGCMIGLSGCAVHPAKVSTTIPQAMAAIQSSLAQAGVVSVSHAGDWTPDQDALFVRGVRAAQCSQDRADPVVGTIAGDVTLQLSGQFTQGGQFTVGSITTAPTFGVQADATRTRGQTVSLPVAYAPLSSLPDVEMGRQLGYEASMLAQNDDARHAEAPQLIADREKLRERVKVVVDSWQQEECTSQEKLAPFAGIKREGIVR